MCASRSDADGERRFSRGRLSRGRGLRKTTGCLTCRRRHVKCDELKPSCGNCIKTSQACVYAAALQDNAVDDCRRNARPAAPLPAPTARLENVASPSDSQQSFTQVTHIDSVVQDPLPRPIAVSPSDQSSIPFVHMGPGAWPAQENISLGPNPAENPAPAHVEHLSPEHGVSSPEAARQHQQHVPQVTCSSPEHYRHSGPYLGAFAPPSAGSMNSNVETATARWLGLLIGDAAPDNGVLPGHDFEATGFDIFGNSIVHTPASETTRTQGSKEQYTPLSPTSNPFLQERLAKLGGDQVLEKQAWHSNESLELLPQEKLLFQNFVQHISCWMDFFDPKKPFGTFVPRLALHNAGLMNAILCLAARYLSLKPCASHESEVAERLNQNDAVQYYYKTLHYIQKAMQYDTYLTSLELLSTTLIISTYEMLDGSSENWERHLKGVFWIQRSQTIHGDSRGLRQAVWWAWLCQDVWAAFREKRKPFTFWRPIRTLDELDPHELAARSIYNFAQAVRFCSDEEREEDGNDMTARLHKADSLLEMLEHWKAYLTVEFDPLPVFSTGEEEVFPPIWIHPPSFGAAMQLYYCSIILILSSRPLSGGIGAYLEQRKMLLRCVKMVCGIAVTQTDYESCVICSQCLFIAGVCIEDSNQRAQVLKLLRERQQRSGWHIKSLDKDLIVRWKTLDQTQV